MYNIKNEDAPIEIEDEPIEFDPIEMQINDDDIFMDEVEKRDVISQW